MKHLFIVNPAAGRGKALKLIPEIEKAFLNKKDEYYTIVTKGPGDATEVVSNYVKRDNYRVYSVGGDGTLNEVLNGVAGSSSSLAVIPTGSGNDFIRSITSNLDLTSLIQSTIEGHEELIDIGKVNGKYFINISSVGFDAQVVYSTVKFKKLPLITGKMAYIMGVITTLFSTKSNKLKVSIDGVSFDKNVLLAAIANAKYYGGGMMPVPQARFDDGQLDICIIDKKNIIEILRFFPKFIKGRHGSINGVNFYTGGKVEIESDKLLALNIDGEVEKVKKAVFEIIPKGLNVVIPKE